MSTDDNVVSDKKDNQAGANNQATMASETASETQVDNELSPGASEASSGSDGESQEKEATDSDKNSIQALQDKLKLAEEKAAAHWEELLRSKAEQDNTRKRLERDVENAHKYAVEKFVQGLLPVIDSLEMGLAAASQDDANISSVKEGTELTLKMFADCVNKFGMQSVDPTGEKFNPEFHQAMSIQETSDQEPDTVIAVMQKGYLLNGRLVRPAMVIVSKAISESTGSGADSGKKEGGDGKKPDKNS